MGKLALCMIVRSSDDEAKLLDQCLASIAKYVDGVFITTNTREGVQPSKKVDRICDKYHAKVSRKFWEDDFAAMRNFNFAQVPKEYDWIIWLDTDDTINSPHKIKDVIRMAKQNIDGVMAKYDYDNDEFGNVVTAHTNLRLVRNNGAFEWRGTLHETLIEKRRVVRVRTEDFKVVHHADNDRKDASNLRNIIIMEQMINAEGTEPDPRTLYYLGTAYIDALRYGEAIELLDAYLKLSGWDEERAQAHVWLGKVYRDQMNDMANSSQHLLQALYENPKEVTAFVELGATFMQLEQWQKAIMWLEQAAVLKVPQSTSLVTNPLENTYRTYMMLAQCRLEIGGEDLQLALRLAEEAAKIRPDSTTKDFVDMLKSIIKEKNTVDSFVNAVRALPKDKALRAYDKLPDDYKQNPAILNIMKLHVDPKTWDKKSIAIYCGSGVLKNWGPWSLATGIGGSEEAVIRLSKHLIKLGWAVTVYADPGTKDGIYDSVEWKNYWTFDSRDTFDVLVIWRAPWLLDAKFKTRKTYLWMHDVTDDAEFTPARLANVDKVMLLSKYHKTVYPSIPEDKVFYSANGIDPAEFVEADGKYERDLQQVVYMSSHVRGLDTLLEIWPDVLAKVPNAKLKIAYGWQSYDEVNRNNPERQAWKELMVGKINSLTSVEDLGRIGQQDIVKLINQSGVWAYPTQFCEIFCHPSGTFVETNRGDVAIDKLMADDSVIDHEGSLRGITAIRKRKHQGKMITVQPKCWEPLSLTPEHPLYAIQLTKSELSEPLSSVIKKEPSFVDAANIRKGDILLTPRHKKTSRASVHCIDFAEYESHRLNNLPTAQHHLGSVAVDVRLAKWLAFFAGDGHASLRGQIIVITNNKRPSNGVIVRDGFESLGIPYTTVDKGNYTKWVASCGSLARYLRKNFYTSDKKKILPNFLIDEYPDEAFIGLHESDGSCSKRPEGGINYSFTNTSRHLISQFRRLLSYRGIAAKTSTREHEYGQDSYSMSWREYEENSLNYYQADDDYLYLRVSTVTTRDYEDYVYNIDVETTHSYLANGIAVHNCITAVKAQAGGAYPITTDFAALDETVTAGYKQHMEAQDEHTPIGVWKKNGIGEFYNELVKALLDPPQTNEQRTKMMQQTRDAWDWFTVAESWSSEFNR